jgi:hypothetical protein
MNKRAKVKTQKHKIELRVIPKAKKQITNGSRSTSYIRCGLAYDVTYGASNSSLERFTAVSTC